MYYDEMYQEGYDVLNVVEHYRSISEYDTYKGGGTSPIQAG